jgi:glutamine synthetase
VHRRGHQRHRARQDPPGDKFLRSIEDESLRLPESIFIQTYTGEYPEEDVTDPVDRDVILHPDPNSIRLVPGTPSRRRR